MSLNVGSLHASLTASTKGWHKAMSGALKSAEALAKNVKRLSGEMATGAAAMSALGGAALHLASAVDGPTKRAMEGLHKSSQLLAVQVADMLLPAVKSLSDTLRTAAAYVAGINPEVKAAVATFATWAVGIAVVGKSLSVVAGLAGNVFGILRAGVGALAAIGSGPLLGIVAGVGLAIGAVLLLHRAWRKNWGGIQEVTEQVVNGLREGFAGFANFMGEVWNHVVESAQRFVEMLLKVGDTIERITGKNLGIGGLREGFKGLFADLKSGEFLSQAFSFGKSVGASIVDGVKEEWAAIKSELGLGDMLKKGSPIGLGRGMGPKGPIVSGAIAAVDGSVAVQAKRAAVAMKELRDAVERTEKAERERAIEIAVAEVGVRKWLQTLNAGVAGVDPRRFAGQMSAGLTAGPFTNATGTGLGFGDAGKEIKEAERELGELRIAAAYAQARRDEASLFEVRKKIRQQTERKANAEVDRAMAPLRSIGAMLKNGLGALGSTINNIANAASQGGPWAALLAAVMEIFNRMQSFQKLLELLEYGLVRLGEFLEPLMSGLFDLVGGITAIATEQLKPLFTALKPLFDGITEFGKGLIPVVHAVGFIFEALAPILEVLSELVGGITKALAPVLEIAAAIIRGVATVLLGIMIGLNELAAAFGDQAARAESARLKGLVDKMWAPSANDLAYAETEAAKAAWRNAAGQNEAAEAARKMAESLSNVPTGYKVALARLNADTVNADTGQTNTLGMRGGKGGGGPVTNNFYGDINSDGRTLDEVAQDARKERARERGQQRGNPTRPGGRGGDD